MNKEYVQQHDYAKGMYNRSSPKHAGYGNISKQHHEDSRTFYPSEKSFAKDSINHGPSGKNRPSVFSPDKNFLDLTEL